MHIDIRGYWTRTSAILSTSSSYHHHSSTSVSSYTPPPYTPSSTPTISSTAAPTQTTSTTEMPSLTTTIRSTLTVTSFLTLTSAFPQIDIPSAIEGLSDCAQSILFPLLADSQCNPGSFPCLCNELTRLNARAPIAATCSAGELAQFDAFQSQFCGNIAVVSVTASTTPVIRTTTTAAPVIANTTTRVTRTALPARPTVTGTGISNATNGTSGPFGPFSNGTGAPIVPPVSLTTSEVVIPTVGPNGEPSSFTTQVVGPVAPTQDGPSGPGFTGAAAAFEAPEFGSMRAGLSAGLLGFMGLMFAGL